MKILLVRPVTDPKHVLNCMPPIGLGYLVTALRRGGHEARILDCVKEGMTHSELMAFINGHQSDIVGFNMFSSDFTSVKKSAADIKKLNPRITVVVGGPHPSGLPQETLRSLKDVDFAFKGEAEIGFPKLADILVKGIKRSFNSVPGLIYREAGAVRVNWQIFPENLDSFSLPAWDQMDPRLYPDAPQGIIFRQKPVAPIMATRGCPFRCTFCAGSSITGKQTRLRSIDDIFNEIHYLVEKFEVREIHILDDNFTLKKGFVRDFCERMIKENLGLTWCCPNGLRLDSLDFDTVKLMKQAGCYYISIGIESGSDRILKLVKKSLTVNQIRREVEMVKKAGLDVNGFFILGFPGETREEILASIRFAKELPLSRVQFYSFIPLPATECYEGLLKTGELDNIDWESAFQTEVPYTPAGISRQELRNLQRKAHVEFYARPQIAWHLLTQIRSFNQLGYILKRAYAYAFAA